MWVHVWKLSNDGSKTYHAHRTSSLLSPDSETVSIHWGADFGEAAMEKVGKEKLATAQ